ncbi:MAG TPA: hypothetical protein VFA81_10870 [Burkholderiales bacterium]|nr:hypothetical protein [Burkholderiales bacterium]
MKKQKPKPTHRKAKRKRNQESNKSNPKHKQDFEALLDLAVKGQK